MMSILALREARRHVDSFTDESGMMRGHSEAMECSDCEALLQLGIDAFQWLVRADETIRQAVYSGAECEADTFPILERLFQDWLKPCALANQWIVWHAQRGSALANRDEFHHCEREVRAIVKACEANVLTDAMRNLRDSAVQEHRDGETAEFV